MNQMEQAAFFRDTLQFWKDLNDQQRNTLKKSMVKQYFAAGESMPSGSENCAGLFLIVHGQVRAYIIAESGREITLYRLFERDICIFSASCMMKNIAFDIFIEVEKDTEAYLIPTSVYRRLSKESLAVQVFSNEIMASRFTDVMWIMEQALFTSFDKRLAQFLLEQSNIDGKDIVQITHERIANHLGTAREVVTRMLKYFQSEGIIRIKRGAIELLDREKIYQITMEK